MTESNVTAARLREMLDGLEGVPGGPWYYDVPDPGYTYDFVKTRHPDFAPTSQDRFRNQIAETDGATLETQKIGKHIARCDPDTMRQIITLALEALALRTPSDGEVVALREIISKCAAALPNGAFISPSASIEFMGKLPGEIASVCSALTGKE